MTKNIDIYDTTLRDGAQMKGISLSVEDKLRILQALDDLAVAYVEGGWPGANPKDVSFFTEAKKLDLKNTELVAFGSTRKATSENIEKDPILKALIDAGTKTICIVGKSSAKQVEGVMKISLEENLNMVKESVEYLKSKGKKVFLDAEHYFDAYLDTPDYSHKFIEAAIDGGADAVVLCDTNGGMLPEQVYEITKAAVDKYGSKVDIGIHVHNDGELAVANSIRAVRAGAKQVQGTINGYGERCGNANLISIIANLQLKYAEDQIKCVPDDKLDKLTSVSKRVAEICNFNHNSYQPYVGGAAFTHKAGLHASAMKKDRTSYEHINPTLIGNITKVLVSDQAGVSNILHWADLRDVKLGTNDEETKSKAAEILAKTKEQESKGYSYENAGASFELLVLDHLEKRPKYFELIEHNVHILNGLKSEATVRIKVGDVEIHTASLGHGPANALDQALRDALRNYYPSIDDFALKDFKVRIIDSHLGTAAITKVQISTSDKKVTWDTIGVSENIIEASWDAIVDSVEFGLMSHGVKPVVGSDQIKENKS